jgi:FkbM family methyltransferase
MKIHVGNKVVKMLNGDRIHAGVIVGKQFEPETRRLWASLCSTHRTMVDVGAYTGIYAISAALHGCKAVAVEPIRHIHERLLKNIAANGVEVQVFNMAASDTNTYRDINYNGKVLFTSAGNFLGKGNVAEIVYTTKLDALNLEHVAAIKIDVERHEPAVLRGARELLAKWKPVLIIEILDEPLKEAVMKELPTYFLDTILDRRNYIFKPKR